MLRSGNTIEPIDQENLCFGPLEEKAMDFWTREIRIYSLALIRPIDEQ
jgi:hypothetical protein